MQFPRLRSRFWPAAAVIAVAAGTGVTTVMVAHAATGCRVTYTVPSQWPAGFTGNVVITNLGDPISSWNLTWTFTAGQRVTQAWNATVPPSSDNRVTATNVSHNATIATNASASFGFNGSWSGSNPAPTDFALNGTPCTGTTTPTNPTTPATPATHTHHTTPPTTTVTSAPPTGNPTWGTAPPPAGAPTSRAYDIIVANDPKGYTPRAGECSKEIHSRYWTYGPDGKVYPTWHPPRDPSGCNFGHEHGDDPRPSDLYATAGWPAFGYANEQMLSLPAERQRHEDHVGHKVLSVNNVNVIQGDNGSSFLPPQGATIATCDVLLKFHQGTHSPDAFTNNIHELILNQRCVASNGGAVTEARYTALIPIGRPGGFSPSECPGFGGPFINVGPASPADSPSDAGSLGRLITEPGCVQAIREGRTHIDPLNPNQPVPFTVSDMDDFWFSNVVVSNSQLNVTIAPLFYVVNPSRYYDPTKADKNGRIIDLCYQNLAGGNYCAGARQQNGGQPLAWDDPRSPFKGTLREFRPGTFSIRNSGPTTVYTDAYGRNPSPTPFAGSIKQYFAGNSSTSLYVRGATRDYAANSSHQIHAPN